MNIYISDTWMTFNPPVPPTLLPGLGPLFLCSRGSRCSGPVLLVVPLCDAAWPFCIAFSMAMVWLLGRRPRTPFLTGSGGSGWGSWYGDCMEWRHDRDGNREGIGLLGRGTAMTKRWWNTYIKCIYTDATQHNVNFWYLWKKSPESHFVIVT